MLTVDTGVVCALLQSSCSAYNAYVIKVYMHAYHSKAGVEPMSIMSKIKARYLLIKRMSDNP